jgi:hypothetical protein
MDCIFQLQAEKASIQHAIEINLQTSESAQDLIEKQNTLHARQLVDLKNQIAKAEQGCMLAVAQVWLCLCACSIDLHTLHVMP